MCGSQIWIDVKDNMHYTVQTIDTLSAEFMLKNLSPLVPIHDAHDSPRQVFIGFEATEIPSDPFSPDSMMLEVTLQSFLHETRNKIESVNNDVKCITALHLYHSQ